MLDKNAAKSWVVAVKATFDVLPDGTTGLAEEQLEPLLVPEYHGDPGTSSLRYEADLTGPKHATDVLLNGHAYAPRPTPAAEFLVRMTVGPVVKTLRVVGDRQWTVSPVGLLMASPAAPVAAVPIVYERAYGGTDRVAPNPAKHGHEARNPIGRGYATSAEHLERSPLPNFFYPDDPVASLGTRLRPAGFGAVASYWSPRRELAGTYDDRWMRERRPLLPEDFDERHFQCAPADQQVPNFLRGGEPVELVNLTPSGVLTFTLPRVHLVFTTRFGGERVTHRARLHTVILEPDVPRVILVWHTSLPCHHRVDALDETIVELKEFVTL